MKKQIAFFPEPRTAARDGQLSAVRMPQRPFPEKGTIGIVLKKLPFAAVYDGKGDLFFCRIFPRYRQRKYVGITNKRSRFLCNIYRQRC